MRLLEWIDQERRDSESIGDTPVLEGLIADGHRIVRVVASDEEDPTAARLPESASLRRLTWSSPSRWGEAAAIRTICQAIEARGIDAIWVRGRGVWSPAIAAAERMSVPIWLEIGSADEAAASRSLRSLADFLVTVPCPSFATLLHPRIRDHLLRVEQREPGTESGRVPLAVPPPIELPTRLRGEAAERSAAGMARAVVVLAGLSTTRPRPSLDRLLGSLSRLAEDPSLSFELFLEEPLGDLKSMPRRLASLGLAERVTRLPPLSRCRGVLGGESIIASPAPLARLEPSLVEAMARGARFVGVSGPALRGWFVDGRDGRLLGSRTDRQHWESALRDAMASPTSIDPTEGVRRWLVPDARLKAVRSVLRRLEGPLQGRFARAAISSGS